LGDALKTNNAGDLALSAAGEARRDVGLVAHGWQLITEYEDFSRTYLGS